MNYNANSSITNHLTAETVTIDDVAALAFRIGKEIWGEEQFSKMMNTTELSVRPNNIISPACNQSAKSKTIRHRSKKTSA